MVSSFVQLLFEASVYCKRTPHCTVYRNVHRRFHKDVGLVLSRVRASKILRSACYSAGLGLVLAMAALHFRIILSVYSERVLYRARTRPKS